MLTGAIIIVAAIVFFARLQVLPWQRTTDEAGQGATPGAVQPGKISAPLIPTAFPTFTPTPTPVPGPVKKNSATAPTVSAIGAVAIDEASGSVLYDKNSRLRRAPASVTKIITAIVAVQRGNVGDVVEVKYDPSELVDSTLMGVDNRDRVTLEDLLFGLMLPSGNDAALAIASHIAGSERAFVDLMNGKMKELRLEDSHFVNPHGLDANGHYTTAYDLAMVSRYAMQNPFFRQLAAAKTRTVNRWRAGEKQSYEIYNLNRLLSIYPGADGIKIGFTENALRTIVGSATRDGHRVYAALLGSTDLWTDTPRILDYVFDNFAWPSKSRE
ncbi:MAG: D-alanyl-D-alanine carboxypeptidase [Chloroflexi bacterium]|nr:D-alanyl-D-alanine carboxypeptidase [Chloroflexota bacterium]